MTVGSSLLCSTALFGTAMADPRPRHAAPAQQGTGRATPGKAAPARATQRPQPARRAPAASNEDVNVTASRNISRGANVVVGRRMMDQFTAGSSPLKILALTAPGVSFGSSDALGLDTAASTFYVRGFNQSQLGGTIDNIPMGGFGFHNWSGLNIDQIEIQENLQSMSVSQGAGAVDMPSGQTLGGALTFTSSDPKDRAGGRIDQSFGSYNGFRTYARADSGILNSTGTKFYVSFARTAQDLWKGYGDQREEQANVKLVQPYLGNRGKLTAVFDYSDFTQYNFLTMTKNMWEKIGQVAMFKPNYQKAKEWAIAAQNGTVPASVQGILTPDEIGNFFWDGSQVQRNYLSSLINEYKLFDNVTSTTVAYGHVTNGDYGGTNNFLTSPTSGVPMALQMGHPDVRRLGFTQSFLIKLRQNDIQTGIWYQNDRFNYPTRLYEDGVDSPHATLSGFKASQATTWWADSFNTNTFQFYLKDVWHIMPNMTLEGGFRSLTQTTHGGTTVDNTEKLAATWGTYYAHPVSGSMTASNAFLPHFAFDYFFLDHHELYWDIAENMRVYDYATQTSGGTPWGGLGNSSNAAQTVFDENKNKLRPERTWNYVVGYRYNSKIFSGSVDFYHTDYYNRLAAVSTGPVNNSYSAYLNVGRETMNGADVMAVVRPFEGLEIINGFSWNDAQYQSRSVPYGGTTIDLKGKHQVFYPKFMYKVNVSYSWRNANVSFNTSYNSAMAMTYTNDVHVPSFWTSSLNASYNFGKIGRALKNFKATFSVSNLFNQNYFGGLYGTAAMSGDDNPILYQAAPREYFGTISAEF
ncbi:TonB-dependent receptor [Gluconacetobacter takamatsuzukensis]|uniref:TonB-dependent receptor n=2 Tax=Gluconacetobacter takamatsuzukensis TaxID=1286190 RepID=A0A7W4KEQ4_9PROT|nr:TonB-dependent receptor [Gluconacetobacter takamatsuzukensis]